MELYHGGGEDAIKFVGADSNLEELLVGYDNICPLSFTDMENFCNICMRHSEALNEGMKVSQYLAFRNVKKGTLDQIDLMHEEERVLLPRMRILFDTRVELLIMKFIVGVAHELVVREFGATFERKWHSARLCKGWIS